MKGRSWPHLLQIAIATIVHIRKTQDLDTDEPFLPPPLSLLLLLLLLFILRRSAIILFNIIFYF